MTFARIERAEERYEGRWTTGRRRVWRVRLSNGRARLCRTRREATEWCEEMGVTIVPPVQAGARYLYRGKPVTAIEPQAEPTWTVEYAGGWRTAAFSYLLTPAEQR